jgi:hypothetical protein
MIHLIYLHQPSASVANSCLGKYYVGKKERAEGEVNNTSKHKADSALHFSFRCPCRHSQYRVKKFERHSAGALHQCVSFSLTLQSFTINDEGPAVLYNIQ